MTIKEAKQIDLVEYLRSQGMHPQKVTGKNYWFISPIRQEKTPSFKIDRQLNKWYDFGEGKGGDLIALLCVWKGCTFEQALSQITDHSPIQAVSPIAQAHAGIQIISASEIMTGALIRYYRTRRIADDIARRYLQEISYENKGQKYRALGFANDRGGFELRTPYFKGSSSPKAPTTFRTNATTLAVFEGFFDFLSYQTLNQNQSAPTRNFLILNSTSFFTSTLPKMLCYQHVYLYLDNDATGTRYTLQATTSYPGKFLDERALYTKHKDYNDWHTNFGKPPGPPA